MAKLVPHLHFCNSCGQETRHKGLWSRTLTLFMEHPQPWDRTRGLPHSFEDYENGEPFEDEEAEETWTVWQCTGCDSLSVTVRIGGNGYLTVTKYFPERTTGIAFRKAFKNMPKDLESLYGEVVGAFNRELYSLSAGGLRALLEGVAVSLSPNPPRRQTFRQRLSSLSHVIPSNILNQLSNFNFLGNRALHELQVPDKETVALALEVTEDILKVVYEMDYKTAHLYRLIEKAEKRGPS